MKVVRIILYGRVQGVGFRHFVAGEAEVSHIEGWVRNRRDGTVEALLAGDAGLIEGLIATCRKGPPVSRIDKIDIEAANAGDLKFRRAGEKFSVLQTA